MYGCLGAYHIYINLRECAPIPKWHRLLETTYWPHHTIPGSTVFSSLNIDHQLRSLFEQPYFIECVVQWCLLHKTVTSCEWIDLSTITRGFYQMSSPSELSQMWQFRQLPKPLRWKCDFARNISIQHSLLITIIQSNVVLSCNSPYLLTRDCQLFLGLPTLY